MNKQIPLIATILLVTMGISSAQQVPDLQYKPTLSQPAYEFEKGPHIAIDEGHNNFHTVDGRYKTFAELLRRDGYQVSGSGKPLSAEALKGLDVLVISNALHEQNTRNWSLPTPSAFSQREILALFAWVKTGGALFLIADHMPFPGAVAELAKPFGVVFSNGYARPGYRKRGKTDIFAHGTGLIENAITRGRTDAEKVTMVATFGGSAFKAPKAATPILVFGPNSVSFETKRAPGITPDAPQVPIEGWYQGAVMEVGDGRVAIFGEAAMFSAQLAGTKKRPMGMNSPDAKQNYQLLLNVIHWLTQAEGMPE